MKKINNFSLFSRSLKYKLRIAFYLIFVLPLLISFYLISNYIFPYLGPRLYITTLVVVDVLIVIGGFLIIRGVIERIILMSSQAKLIADGDLDHRIDVTCEDEIGDLGDSLNQLTEHIRNNIIELKGYSEKTTEINLEIQKRIVMLSSLLQISSLISQGARLDEIIKIAVEKSRQIVDSDAAYFLFKEPESDMLAMKIADGVGSQYLSKIRVNIEKSIFSNAVKSRIPLVLDEQSPIPVNIKLEFYEKFRLKNTVAQPIYSNGQIIAILGIGNTKEKFTYKKDTLDIIDIFAKHIAIAVENDLLMHRVETLEIRDTLTGLYNASFIHTRLQEEIKRSMIYQRPCSYILLDIDNFKKYQEICGVLVSEATLKRIASLIKDSVSEIDRVARVGSDQFAILLPEKNKRQSIVIAENIRKKIEFSFSEDADANKRLTVSAGLSENPIDGIDADEVIKKANNYLALAKGKGKNKIVNKLE